MPAEFADHACLAHGSPTEIVEFARGMGYSNLYIDGGKTIQRFLDADLIDEVIVSEIPILLGGGQRLFGALEQQQIYELVSTEVLLDQIVKKHHRRKR